MKIEEKAGNTLAELGVTDASGVVALFAEVRAAMEEDLENLRRRGALDDAERFKMAKEARDRWLSRKNGIVSLADENWLKKAPIELKPAVGRAFNELRQFGACMKVEELIKVVKLLESRGDKPEDRSTRLMPDPNGLVQMNQPNRGARDLPEAVRAASGLVEPILQLIDLTLPGLRRPVGSIHPIIRVQREIEDIFLGLGFKIETGPEIESVYYNFDALNIPETHPSRDDFDTIYIDGQTLLRTHTSPVQIRAMEKWVKEGSQGGLYIITPGKCYRNDNPDATHSPMFHQCEGLAIDTDITFADLKGTLDYFARKFFGEKTRTSFHPTFFPFTEPSGEVAVSCYVCGGAGCRTCKESGWIELMGCGMVHPQVLKNGGIDPERYSGWAFGLGIDRFTMARYGINDIQLFFQGDVRFLEQF
ncbi:MAG TPA: phenylalanine--tRNA ligase subunit alpha [Terriglobia bacterium]|nr:phenylalanine--tRNA ligase subunit alpha [Terriglobia bacterium]